MIFEVIAHNLTDVKHAEAYGADRIELVKSMGESGITPSYGLIKTAVESVSIPVNVIVRPHGRTFVYSEDDVQEMLHDIDIVKEISEENGRIYFDDSIYTEKAAKYDCLDWCP